MVGTIIWGLVLALGGTSSPAIGPLPNDDPPATKTEKRVDSAPGGAIAPLGEDLAVPFEPLHPRTTAERRALEAVVDFTTGRALEAHRDWRAAIDEYQHALEKLPAQTTILRRISKLCFDLGRSKEAVDYANRVLEAEPNDTEMITRLLEYHVRKGDFTAAEAALLEVKKNPRLAQGSAGAILIDRDLGELYATRLDQPEKAAAAFARVVEALDAKAANSLSTVDLKRILGNNEAEAYARFAEVFQEAKRLDLAIKAYRRGLAYEPDHPELARLLAQSLLQANKGEEALAALEPYLRRQPTGREPYDLLIRILTSLHREAEILPRLEAAARNDPQNAPLQYLLADRYRAAGQPEKADALYKELLATQPDNQGFGALASSLLKEKKYEELIDLLGKALPKKETLQAVMPQVEAIANDPEAVHLLLEKGLELQKADPPRLTKDSFAVLSYIATKAKKTEDLLPIQRLSLQHDPDPKGYRELWSLLYQLGKYDEAADTLSELIQKFPAEKTPQILNALGQSYSLANHFEKALEAAQAALDLKPTNDDLVQSLRLRGYALSRLNRNEEAIAHYKSVLDRFPRDEELTKMAHSGLSVVYVNMDQFDKGEAELEVLLKRDPEDPGVNNDLGYLYADQGKNLEQAEVMIRKAIAAEPDHSAYLDSLGWVLYRRGKTDEAVEPLEKAVKDRTADATVHDHLGDVYFKLKRIPQAREQWQAAEKMAAATQPPDRHLEDIRRKLRSLEELDRAAVGAAADHPKP